jgi:hypothetical protein
MQGKPGDNFITGGVLYMYDEKMQESNFNNPKSNMSNYNTINMLTEQGADDFQELDDMTTLNNISSMMSMDSFKNYSKLK